MDAYVLGNHEGDLPAHLLTEGEPGNRVRAMAKLDGPDHNAYYALEAPDEQSLDALTTTIISAGTAVTKSMTVCMRPPCVGGVGNPNGNPSFMPPFERYLFFWLETSEAAEAIEAARQQVGPEGVHAATDGEGHSLVQLGSDSDEAIERASAALTEAAGDAASVAHAVTPDGILRG